MISISKLLCGAAASGDELRYGKDDSYVGRGFAQKRPIVVWSSTRRCNLHCVHCYADSSNRLYADELGTQEARAFIQDLADFGVPVLLFSGGEPLIREDLFELAAHARQLGLRVVVSTNGTLITSEVAKKIRDTGFAEAGISLDGIGARNDQFRQHKGAYNAALQGLRNCLAVGQKVSLRFTITRSNYEDLPAIFDLIEREDIPRACFYHLAYAGRAGNIQSSDISHQETRAVIDLICDRTASLHRRGKNVEVLTVDNHADGVYLYMKVLQQQPERAAEVLSLLQRNGGNNSGLRIASVDNTGEVHADQFWWHYSFGNVRRRKFGDIWLDTSDPLMCGLKERKPLLKGRCAACRFLDICNGNLRVRAESVHGDIWADDPACYLSDEEIGLEEGAREVQPA